MLPMERLLDTLRSAIGPTRGTSVYTDPVSRYIIDRLRVRRPRGAVEMARFVEDARRALRHGRVPAFIGPEPALESFSESDRPRGTHVHPPSPRVPLDASFS